jgi:hypothetical protein
VPPRRECPYCGSLTDPGAHSCKLCGRPLAGGTLVHHTMGEQFLNADGVTVELSRARVLPHGFEAGDIVAAALGPLFIVGYPWLLYLYAQQVVGSLQSAALLTACWVAPEVYLLSGFAKAAQFANVRRSFAWGLLVPGVSLAAQLVALFLSGGLFPPAISSAVVFGLSGGALMWTGPMALFATGSAVCALVASLLPKAVPGRFQRVFLPEITGITALAVALFLPRWGGIALAQASLRMGFLPLFVGVIIVFLSLGFVLFWFRSKE